MILFSTSNQNGAPRETASAVISHPNQCADNSSQAFTGASPLERYQPRGRPMSSSVLRSAFTRSTADVDGFDGSGLVVAESASVAMELRKLAFVESRLAIWMQSAFTRTAATSPMTSTMRWL